MWVNKHCPKTFDEIVGNKDVVQRFKTMAISRNVQHMVLCGPTGVGKSTMVNILVQRVLGKHMQHALLRFNSSDDRGIQSIREKIHQFVPKLIGANHALKIIVFEEAETIGEGVQQMMRRLMEKHSHHTAFIFVCTNMHGIIETLQSRCQIFRLGVVTPDESRLLLSRICEAEGVRRDSADSATGEAAVIAASTVVPDGDDLSATSPPSTTTVPAQYEDLIQRIALLSRGDVRRSVNLLQMCCSLRNQSALTRNVISTRCLYPHHDSVRNIVHELLHGTLKKCITLTRSLYEEGYSGIDIIMFIHDYVIDQEYLQENTITRVQHLCIIKQVGITHVRLSEVDSFCKSVACCLAYTAPRTRTRTRTRTSKQKERAVAHIRAKNSKVFFTRCLGRDTLPSLPRASSCLHRKARRGAH